MKLVFFTLLALVWSQCGCWESWERIFNGRGINCSLDATSPNCTTPNPQCGCWDGWESESYDQFYSNSNNETKVSSGWICKKKNSTNTFPCNVEKPPSCICKEKGNPVNVSYPATNCVFGDNPNRFDKKECESNAEWEAWFHKYPNIRLYYYNSKDYYDNNFY